MPLELIPVIDLMQGHVVHARLGQRTQYQPLQSALAGGSSEALRVVDGLLALHPFNRLYIADLDAITGHGDHAATIDAIAQSHPEVELWLDSGLGALPAADVTSTIPVLGSESLRTLPSTKADTDAAPHGWVLSLDFHTDQLLGPPELLQHTTSWPRDIIAMTLDRVGGAQGPDLQRVSALKTRVPTHRIYAAGGVRDARDLVALAQSGAHGVLLASALHDGRLRADDLRRHAPGV